MDDHHVSRWMAEREPLVWVHLEREEELSGILDRETAVHDATLMLALCLDEDVSNSTRLEIAADLDEMLSDAAFEHDFSALWHSRLLPPDAAMALSSFVAVCGSLERLSAWAGQILRRQQMISDLCLAWDLIPSAAFPNNSRESVRDYCRQHGYFYAAALALENDGVEGLLAECLMHEGFPASANRRILFTSWFVRFRHKHQRYEQQAEPGDWEDQLQVEQSEVHIRINGLVAFEEVERRKAEIKQHLDRNELPQAETKTQWLRDYQIPRGGRALCAKSLCDLAAYARRQDIIGPALKWSHDAVELAPHDPFTRNEYAECLLKSGSHEEALKVYQQTRIDHPLNAVAQNGYAECLREQGRLEEALKVYQQTRIDHPRNAFAQCGYAECLREQGSLEEALKVYQQTRIDHPLNAVAQCGYAECLREQGSLEEALKVYEEARAEHPRDRVVRNALATLLGQIGKHAEGLQLLPAAKPFCRQDWIDAHVRGMILLRMGRWDEAEIIFTSAMNAKLNRVNRGYFRASLAVCRLKQRKFKEVMQEIESISMPSRLEAPFNLLRAHALAGDGQIEKSRVILDGVSTPRKLVVAVGEELRHRFVENRPQHDEQWLLDKEVEMILCS